MTTYTYELPWGDKLIIEANLVEASAPIYVDGYVSPFQTADAHHREIELLPLVLAWLGPDFYGRGEGALDETIEESELICEEQSYQVRQ